MPPARVRRARHARGELVAALAGEDEVRVAVDEARDDAAPARVDARVRAGARPAALDRRDALAVEHERRVAHGPELGVVRDEQADVVDRERAHGASTSRSSRATSIDDVRAVAHDPAPADHDVAHVGGAGAEHDAVERRRARRAGRSPARPS